MKKKKCYDDHDLRCIHIYIYMGIHIYMYGHVFIFSFELHHDLLSYASLNKKVIYI